MKSEYTSKATGKVVWRYDFIHQKIRYREKGFKTKAEARKAEESKRREVTRNQTHVIADENITFDQFVPAFLEHRETTRAARTVHGEIKRSKPLAKHFHNRRLALITTGDIHDYVSMRKKAGKKNRGINLELSFLRSFFKYAVERNLLYANPVLNVKNLRETRTEQWIPTREELDRFIAAAQKTPSGTHLVHWSWLRVYSGARHYESFFLQWEDLDFDNGRIKILPKEGNELKNATFRVVEMHPELRPILMSWKKEWTRIRGRAPEPKDWVFFHPRKSKQGQRADGYGKSFLQARKEADLPKLTSKTFRHYFISHCVMSGVDFYTIAKWAGHRDTTMIQRIYAHLAPDYRAKEMRKLTFDHGKKGKGVA